MKRREFIKASAGTASVLCTCSLGFGLTSCAAITGNSSTPEAPAGSFTFKENKLIIDLAKIPELKQNGYSVKIEDKKVSSSNFKIIIAHTGNRNFLAYENRCTHGGREIEYLADENKFQCISFGHSSFTLDGKVISGPADSPLKKYRVEQKDEKLMISLV